jgi:hypothetical protein
VAIAIPTSLEREWLSSRGITITNVAGIQRLALPPVYSICVTIAISVTRRRCVEPGPNV